MMPLLISAALIGGFVAGALLAIHETLRTIERYYPMAWKVLLLERANDKKKRADAARDKEARP